MSEISDYLKDKFGEDGIWRSNFRQWDFDMVMKYGEFDKDDVVLDTGALHSYFCVYLAQFVRAIFAVDDFSWAERDYYPKSGLPAPEEWAKTVAKKTDGIAIGKQADVRDLPYAVETFDKVLSISTIEHIDDDEKAMREMMRVLKPGGLLLVTTEYAPEPKEYSEKDGSYYRLYDEEGIESLTHNYRNVEENIVAPTELADFEGRGFTTVFLKIRKEGE